MLYLSRKKGESIIINGNISIEVVDVKRNVVKLGFVFPDDISVLRKEVFEKIQKQNQEAGRLTQNIGALLGDDD